jgi:hypothetical protein
MFHTIVHCLDYYRQPRDRYWMMNNSSIRSTRLRLLLKRLPNSWQWVNKQRPRSTQPERYVDRQRAGYTRNAHENLHTHSISIVCIFINHSITIFIIQGYRPCAQRSSILFFVLNDMGRIDPMYQFSLDSYIDLFNNSIEKSQRSPNLEIRIQNLNDYHTYSVYK